MLNTLQKKHSLAKLKIDLAFQQKCRQAFVNEPEKLDPDVKEAMEMQEDEPTKDYTLPVCL